ncbi:class II aldolase/adducin family protein [Paracoccaceae bacterium Fryx2]|nr:class II aldolase/adducin family protein [Paracoccaceae bacterium Fryx2]
MTPSESAQRQALVEAARTAERRGLNAGTAGNISLRCGDGLLITPTGIAPAALTPEQIVRMDFDGRWEGSWKPSSEWLIHARILRAFPAGAVVHAHPDHCVALSCLREPLPAFHYMIASFGGDDVPCARYETFGTPALADAVLEALQGRTACLMANHGMVCLGATLEQALLEAEKLEMLARHYMLARGIGSPVILTPAEMAEVRGAYATYGQQDVPA